MICASVCVYECGEVVVVIEVVVVVEVVGVVQHWFTIGVLAPYLGSPCCSLCGRYFVVVVILIWHTKYMWLFLSSWHTKYLWLLLSSWHTKYLWLCVWAASVWLW